MSISLEKAVVARLERKGNKFEILVDPFKAFEFKQGKPYKIEEILAVNDIFKDARKAERVSANELKQYFGTTDIYKIAEEILKNGEIQIPTELKRKLIEEKKNQIINLISKRFVNPQNGLPHPPQRIALALEQAKVNIDPFIDAEVQLENIVKELKKIIPLRIEFSILEVRIPLNVGSKIINELKRMKINILEERWTENYLFIKMKIISATKDEIFSLMYKYSKDIEIKEVGKEHG
ncbi:MAG: ribosome assembly factor SBDS [Candidatus Aenigmatarchaeota archaeon]